MDQNDQAGGCPTDQSGRRSDHRDDFAWDSSPRRKPAECLENARDRKKTGKDRSQQLEREVHAAPRRFLVSDCGSERNHSSKTQPVGETVNVGKTSHRGRGGCERRLWGLRLPKDTGVLEELGAPFTFPPAFDHIFLKEVIAARIGIERACKIFPGHHIVFLEDNTAAAGAITRGWSTSLRASKEIGRIHDCLQRTKCTITVRAVPSAANPADEPSRLKKLDHEKVTNLMPLFKDPEQVLNLPKEKSAPFTGRLRHYEECDDVDEEMEFERYESMLRESNSGETEEDAEGEAECAEREENRNRNTRRRESLFSEPRATDRFIHRFRRGTFGIQ